MQVIKLKTGECNPNNAGNSHNTIQTIQNLHNISPNVGSFPIYSIVRLGDRVHASCVATRGDLPLQFSWLLDDSPLDAALPNIKITIDDFSSHISISSLTEAHDATYTCSVANEGGSVKHSARLQVTSSLTIQV